MDRVYLDHAATTPLDPAVVEAMARAMRELPGNPSSVHAEGRAAREAVERARDEVARAIGAERAEIVFTGGGTEADNLALRGTLLARRGNGDGLVTTAVEHHAVLDTAQDLARQHGARLTVLPVDGHGRVSAQQVEAALDDRTVLVSVMHGNNEVGTLQPIAEIGRVCRERGVTFHSDAIQTPGLLEVDVRRLSVDLMSFSGHKLHGPKGVGALYVRRGVRLATVQTGGGQEAGRRTGTENVAGIVGFGVAMRLARERRATEAARQARLRDRIVEGVRARVPDVIVTGHPTERLPNHASFCFPGARAERVLLGLDLAGFAVSSGSACTSGSSDPSHVLLAMGLDADTARSAVRLTLGPATTDAAVDRLLEVLPPIVERMRAASPLSV